MQIQDLGSTVSQAAGDQFEARFSSDTVAGYAQSQGMNLDLCFYDQALGAQTTPPYAAGHCVVRESSRTIEVQEVERALNPVMAK